MNVENFQRKELSHFLRAGKGASWKNLNAMVEKTLYDRIIERIGELGWTQAEAARQARVGYGALTKLRATANPGLETVKKLSDAMGVRFDWLAFGTGPKFPPTESDRANIESAVQMLADMEEDERDAWMAVLRHRFSDKAG